MTILNKIITKNRKKAVEPQAGAAAPEPSRLAPKPSGKPVRQVIGQLVSKVIRKAEDVEDKGGGGNGGTPKGLVLPGRAAAMKVARDDAMRRGAEAETGSLKQRPYYSDEVMLKLVNLLYDTVVVDLFHEAGLKADIAHLIGLTRINNSREAWYWAQRIAKEAAYNKYAKGFTPSWSIGEIQMVAFLLARRSIPGQVGPGFMLGVGLAQEQSITKAEEAGEEADF